MHLPFPFGAQRGVANCLVCNRALSTPRTQHVLLCGSADCLGRYARLRPHEKCEECGRPITWQQQATRVCDDAHCRQMRLVQRPMEAERAARARQRAEAESRRDRALAATGVPTAERGAWPVAVVPRFRARTSRLPSARRATFTSHLRALLRDARVRYARGDTVTLCASGAAASSRSPRQLQVEALLGATCAACRGACCRKGSDHAFLTEDTMLAYLHRVPSATDDDVLSHYLSYLPERTLTQGCVYQRADGCALPRDLRGAMCNRYLCSGLLSLRDAHGDTAPIQAYVVHREGEKLTSGRFLRILPG